MPIFTKDQILVFDGGIGTELYERGFYINRPFEELNLNSPNDVQAVHQAYLDAGAEVLTTNSFSITKWHLKKFDIEHQQKALIEAALKNAAAAVEKFSGVPAREASIQVGFSMGPLGVLIEPLGPTGRDEAANEFQAVAKTVRSLVNENSALRLDLYILETFSNLQELVVAIQGIRRADPSTPILASMTLTGDEKGRIEEFVKLIADQSEVQAVGLNCSAGPGDLLGPLRVLRSLTKKPIVIQPNAGLPRQVDGRYFYMTSPDYLAKYAKRYVEAGAAGVGGCCGTGPAHIQAIANAVRMVKSQRVGEISGKYKLENGETGGSGSAEGQAARGSGAVVMGPVAGRSDSPSGLPTLDSSATRRRPQSRVLELLDKRQKIISVEINPPKGTDLSKLLASIDKLEAAGVDFVNLPDGARASARMSSLHLAGLINRRPGHRIQCLPHFTTRDRNLIALQADLIGAYVGGVHDILLITGDPPKLGNNKEATAVYDIDSIGLTYLAHCLNHGVTPTGENLGSGTGYGIGVAANPTAINLDKEIQRWHYKVESGADYAVTQPIYEPESYLRWLEKIGASHKPHLVGIWPFISLRNAEFMANEVPGVSVPKWAVDEMAKAGDNPDEAVKRGVDIAQRVMTALEKDCQGFCISAPLGRVEVAIRAMDGARENK